MWILIVKDYSKTTGINLKLEPPLFSETFSPAVGKADPKVFNGVEVRTGNCHVKTNNK